MAIVYGGTLIENKLLNPYHRKTKNTSTYRFHKKGQEFDFDSLDKSLPSIYLDKSWEDFALLLEELRMQRSSRAMSRVEVAADDSVWIFDAWNFMRLITSLMEDAWELGIIERKELWQFAPEGRLWVVFASKEELLAILTTLESRVGKRRWNPENSVLMPYLWQHLKDFILFGYEHFPDHTRINKEAPTRIFRELYYIPKTDKVLLVRGS